MAVSEAGRISDFVYELLTRSSAHVRGATERTHEEGEVIEWSSAGE